MREGGGSAPSPGVSLSASWRRWPRSTTACLSDPFLSELRPELGTCSCFPEAVSSLAPCPARCPVPLPTRTAKLWEGSSPGAGRSRRGTPLRTPTSQPGALLPPSGRTEEDAAPTRGNQFRDRNYHKK